MEMHYQDNADTPAQEPSVQVAGRFVGMAVFLAGIALLVLTFVMAFQAFRNPEFFVPIQALNATPAPSTAAVLVPAIIKFILLIAMVYISSLIAGRGAQLFLYSRKEARRDTPRD
jgi:uncharacterized protein YqhQ